MFAELSNGAVIRGASKRKQGCIKRIFCRGVPAQFFVIGQRGRMRSRRRRHVAVIASLRCSGGRCLSTKLVAAQSSQPTPEPPATDGDSRGNTPGSDLSRQIDRRGGPGIFRPSQSGAAAMAGPEKARSLAKGCEGERES